MRKTLLFAFCLMFGCGMMAQNTDLSFLRQKCPKLTEMYQDELGKYHSQYIFAIDVSETMKKYKDAVQPALAEFFAALPDGDQVTVIPFGTQAKKLMDLSGKIDEQGRQSLIANIDKLYDNPNYEKDMKKYTDIEKACQSISKEITLSTDFKNYVVIILTDFRNDDGTEKKLDKGQLERMDQDFAAASQGMYTRVVALDLATAADKQKPGYCLNQLKESVFYATTNGMEIVSLTNPGPQIQEWFTNLKREIMVEKMRAIIDNENKMAPAKLETKISIDGNVQAHISWTPSKLYPMMKIGKTTVGNPDFEFVDDTTLWQNTLDTVLDLELGQIKHKNIGFHQLNDSLCLGIDLPTEYDSELQWLKVKKPLPNTNTMESRMIFTFFLPFWLCVTIAILLIIYIIGVIKAIGRNAKYTFKGKMTVYDSEGNQIEDVSRKIPEQRASTIKIGQGANGVFGVSGAEWSMLITKKNGNPFLVVSKPYFEWRCSSGFVASNKSQSGRLDYDNNTSVRVKCGHTRSELTHAIKVQLVK